MSQQEPIYSPVTLEQMVLKRAAKLARTLASDRVPALVEPYRSGVNRNRAYETIRRCFDKGYLAMPATADNGERFKMTAAGFEAIGEPVPVWMLGEVTA